jgi:RNA polymerase sigma-70 factor (ECF subfamily)
MPLSVDMTLSELGLRSRVEEAATAVPMDEDAFRAFYERTARPVWAYLRRITGDAQLADDLLQEAYYRFYRASVAHEDESHRRNYLYRIATNLARDHARKHRHGYDVALPGEGDPDQLRDDGATAVRAHTRMDLGRAMSQLGAVQRQMLWLAYAHGSSHDEIAKVVGVNTGAVKALLYRARRKLATLLRGHDLGGKRE